MSSHRMRDRIEIRRMGRPVADGVRVVRQQTFMDDGDGGRRTKRRCCTNQPWR